MIEPALIIILVIAGMAMVAVMTFSFRFVFRSSLLDVTDDETWTEPLFNGLAIVAVLAFLSWFNLRLTPSPALIELNVTGAIVPIIVSIYLLFSIRAGWARYLAVTSVVATMAFLMTEMSLQGIFISIWAWIFIVVVCVSLSLLLSPGDVRGAMGIAYVSSSMGMLLGGDVLKFLIAGDFQGPFIIGAWGLMDFVFLSGVISIALILVYHAFLRLISSIARVRVGS